MAVHVSYGSNVSHDGELRLIGDLNGKRAIELGISPHVNCVALARAGAKAIALDPSPTRIAAARQTSDREGVRVEFHEGDLGDLGFATSTSVDLVLCTAIGQVDDLSRVLRQVHRVLKPEAAFVAALPHPITSMLDGSEVTLRRPYGQAPARTISDIFTALLRANFRIDNMHELFPVGQLHAMVPAMLVVRARKQGI
jgi:SAM-dependent methyltransferase